MNTNTRLGLHSTRNKIFRFCMGISSVYILVLSFFTLFPYYEDIERAKAEGAPNAVQSAINLDVTSSTAELNFSWTGGTSGTFASSGDAITFDASTNNASGYTLKYMGSNDAGTLTHEDGEFSFSSISSPLTLNDFSATANNTYNNKWGFKPSKYVSGNSVINNTGAAGVFLPVPTTTGVIIDKTNAPNTNEENYTIEIGARADMNIVAGEYTGTYDLLITANPVSYRITYAAGNTTDEIQNLPEAQNSSTSDTFVTLSSETPTRAHHSFLGWCDVLPTTTNGTDSCTGTNEVTGSPATQYVVGSDFGINQTTQNNTTLYAMWQIDTFTCTKQYRLENADGSWSDYVADGEETINYGGSCVYNKSVTDYKNSASGTNGAQASATATNVASDQTLSLDFYRNTYTLGVVNGSNITRVTGSGTYKWGQTVTVTATPKSNTACVTYSTPTWSVGGNGTASSTSGTSIDYTMDKGMAILTAISTDSRVAQTVTLSRGTGVSSIKIDGADYSGSSVSLYCGTHDVSGNYDSGYEFSSWTVASNVSVTSTSSANPTLVVSGGGGTLTLNARKLPSIQSITPSTCTTTATRVYDVRDNSVYTIQKLADDKCWLLDNLRLDLTNATVKTNLTSSTTNASDTTLSYLKNGGGTTSDKYATARVSSSWSTNSYSAPLINTTSKDVAESEYGKYGVYYNYCAATAGSYCYGDGESYGVSSGDATEDICPKGWRMPTGGGSGEYMTLYGLYGAYSDFRTAFHAPLSGSFDGGSASLQNTMGLFWSSSRSSALGNSIAMDHLRIQSSRVDDSTGWRLYGESVRCVLKATDISQISTMQDFASNDAMAIKNSMIENQQYTLTDSRSGNKSYTVAKIGSLIWMTTNLDLPGGTTLTPSDSNVASNYTLPTSSTSGFSNDTTAYVYNSNSTTCGDGSPCYGYYSYAAATAGTNPSSGNAQYDICPKGWRLPTQAEFTALTTTYTTGDVLVAAPFNGVYAGSYYGSSFDYGGSVSVYWSSTADSASYAYNLYLSGFFAIVNGSSKGIGGSVRCVAP